MLRFAAESESEVSTYEIDDEVVRGLVDNRDLLPPRLLSAVAALEEQIPLPTPTKIGAVVRTSMKVRGPRVFIRTAVDGHTGSPWQEMNASDEPALPSEQIGRITEVLSEGVDL